MRYALWWLACTLSLNLRMRPHYTKGVFFLSRKGTPTNLVRVFVFATVAAPVLNHPFRITAHHYTRLFHVRQHEHRMPVKRHFVQWHADRLAASASSCCSSSSASCSCVGVGVGQHNAAARVGRVDADQARVSASNGDAPHWRPSLVAEARRCGLVVQPKHRRQVEGSDLNSTGAGRQAYIENQDR